MAMTKIAKVEKVPNAFELTTRQQEPHPDKLVSGVKNAWKDSPATNGAPDWS